MSLYREHQRIERLKDWTNAVRFAFPAAVILKISGCNIFADMAGTGWWVFGATALMSFIGWGLYPQASRQLTQFVASVNANEKLLAQYQDDAVIGRWEDMITGLRNQQTMYLTLGAAAAKRGDAVAAGLLYGQAKTVESHLRKHGC